MVGPIFVEVDERVDASVPLGAHAQVVEIGVDLEETALRTANDAIWQIGTFNRYKLAINAPKNGSTPRGHRRDLHQTRETMRPHRPNQMHTAALVARVWVEASDVSELL